MLCDYNCKTDPLILEILFLLLTFEVGNFYFRFIYLSSTKTRKTLRETNSSSKVKSFTPMHLLSSNKRETCNHRHRGYDGTWTKPCEHKPENCVYWFDTKSVGRNPVLLLYRLDIPLRPVLSVWRFNAINLACFYCLLLFCEIVI